MASPRHVHNIPGMSFTRLKFYKACLTTATPKYIGEMMIKSTNLKEDTSSESTWTQDFEFTNDKSEIIFHFKRVSRAHYLERNTKYIDLVVRSFLVDSVNQDYLQENHDANLIFDQFTQDKIYLSNINEKMNFYVSTPFDGIIFYSRSLN